MSEKVQWSQLQTTLDTNTQSLGNPVANSFAQSSEQRPFRPRIKPQLYADGSQQDNHLAVFGDARKVEHNLCRQRFGFLCSENILLIHIKHQHFVCQRVLPL